MSGPSKLRYRYNWKAGRWDMVLPKLPEEVLEHFREQIAGDRRSMLLGGVKDCFLCGVDHNGLPCPRGRWTSNNWSSSDLGRAVW